MNHQKSGYISTNVSLRYYPNRWLYHLEIYLFSKNLKYSWYDVKDQIAKTYGTSYLIRIAFNVDTALLIVVKSILAKPIINVLVAVVSVTGSTANLLIVYNST